MDNEIPIYKKKKNSNVSKSKNKAKHKHIYKDCLLIEEGRPYKASYCSLCGKIGEVKFFLLKEDENTNSIKRVYTDEELFDKFRDLEKFEVTDVFQKYVNIGESDEN